MNYYIVNYEAWDAHELLYAGATQVKVPKECIAQSLMLFRAAAQAVWETADNIRITGVFKL